MFWNKVWKEPPKSSQATGYKYTNPHSHIQFYKLTKPSSTTVIKGWKKGEVCCKWPARWINYNIPSKNLILYHGTTLSRGEEIIKNHCIKHDISRVCTNTGKLDCDTTNGYVYLTPNIETAYFYGNLNSLRSEKKDDLKYVYIFKVEINEDKLLPDYDELKIKKLKVKM